MIIDMHIHPIFYEAVCKDKEELEFRKNAFGVFKQSPYGYDEMFAEMDYAHVDKGAAAFRRYNNRRWTDCDK